MPRAKMTARKSTGGKAPRPMTAQRIAERMKQPAPPPAPRAPPEAEPSSLPIIHNTRARARANADNSSEAIEIISVSDTSDVGESNDTNDINDAINANDATGTNSTGSTGDSMGNNDAGDTTNPSQTAAPTAEETAPFPQFYSQNVRPRNYIPLHYRRIEGEPAEEWSIEELKLLLGVQVTLSELHVSHFLDFPALRVRGRESIINKLQEIHAQVVQAFDVEAITAADTAAAAAANSAHAADVGSP